MRPFTGAADQAHAAGSGLLLDDSAAAGDRDAGAKCRILPAKLTSFLARRRRRCAKTRSPGLFASAASSFCRIEADSGVLFSIGPLFPHWDGKDNVRARRL